MNKVEIKDAFQNGKAMIAFVTGGDPDIETTEKLLPAMEEAGADLIEIGIPFSDPIAEGPVIQEANERALSKGCTTDHLFDMVKRVRERGKVTVPIVYLTYANPIYTYGKEKFMSKCQECGVNGIIVPDVPFEEKNEFLEEAEAHNVAIISMIAPTSEERIIKIAKQAKGFLYVVSSLGVTGVRKNITTNIDSMIELVRKASDIPTAVGFGISTPEQASEMAQKSDGAIIGSAIVKIVGEYGRDCIPHVQEYIRTINDAIKSNDIVEKVS